jgi:hypothetical protein
MGRGDGSTGVEGINWTRPGFFPPPIYATMPRVLYIIGGTLYVIAIINFTTFWIIAVSIGGDAIQGKAEGGRYYVSDHGKMTGVSSGVWRYSRVHTISVWITHPVGIFVGGGLVALSGRLKKAA